MDSMAAVVVLFSSAMRGAVFMFRFLLEVRVHVPCLSHER